MKKLILNAVMSLAAIVGVVVVSNAHTGEGNEMENAYFAGGCFWCIESDFEKLYGIGDVESGYINTLVKPEETTYKTVSAGRTGAVEAIRVPYDPTKVTYTELVKYLYQHIDPLDGRGQFCDKGPQYISAIYPQNKEELKIAMDVSAEVSEVLGQAVATTVQQYESFVSAEEYHQNYAKKNPIRYKYYRGSCGRDKRVKQVWAGKTLSE